MKFTGVENAGLDKKGPNRKGGKRGTKFAGGGKGGTSVYGTRND